MINQKKLLDDIKNTISEYERALDVGDHKTMNKLYGSIIKSLKRLDSYNHEEILDSLNNLLTSNSPMVILITACYLISRGIDKDKGLKLLKILSQKTDIGVLSVDAEMTLKEYKKNGKLVL